VPVRRREDAARRVGFLVGPVTHNGIFAALLLGQEAKQQHNETESHNAELTTN
jgi:hypothetical protein